MARTEPGGPPMEDEKLAKEEYGDPGAVEKGILETFRRIRLTRRLEAAGVESIGIRPIPLEERQDTQFYKIFFIWLSSNFNILSFSAGTLGPVAFGLGIRDSCLTILFFNLLFCAMPAYAGTWGPRLGMRQMVISRYSFGYYGVLVPCVLNLIGMIGFSILNCILGGQALASVSNQDLSWTVGIVIIGVIALVVSFCGYTILNWYERVAWIPVLVTFAIALGVSGKHLGENAFEPGTARQILGFASTLAGYTITWTPLASDFTAYYRSDVKSWRLFLYSYLGLSLSITPLQCVGAVIVASASAVPLWEQAYASGDVGGLLEATLRPTHGFGKFLTVLLSLSVIGNIAMTFYSMCFNLQLSMPLLARVPRYLVSIIGAVVVVTLAIVGQHKFYDTLVNFLGLIGYWAGAFVAIIFLEHLVFRKGDFSLYDPGAWDSPRLLPTGVAALGAAVLSFGLVIPCMEQAWFVGPIAKSTGDIGFEVAFGLSTILYLLLRWIEIRWRGRL